MTAITYRQAKERLCAPDADLNSLRAELAVLMDAVDNNHFPYDGDRDPWCGGFTLWVNPDNPKQRVRVRNRIITCEDGAQHSISAEDLWIEQTSEIEPRVRLDYGSVSHDKEATPYSHHEVVTALADIIGCEVSSKVCYGFDGFYHYTFKRQFRRYDRQRLRAEQALTFMQSYDCVFGRSAIEIATGRIEVIVQLHEVENPVDASQKFLYKRD